MKINERTLIAYACGSDPASPVDKEGCLWKRGEVNKNFQKRYFVLKGNLLFYFDKRGDKEPVGVVILEGCTIELAEDEQEKFAFKIAFHGEGKRTYVLGTDSQEVLEDWMKLLACASYDYMKLMVLELQQQLAELEESERLAASTAAAPVTATLSNGSVSSPVEEDGGGGGEPKAPPRQRANPFNQLEPKKTPKKSWLKMHEEYGLKIQKDRTIWCQNKKDLLGQEGL